jgi:hypothetical protein
VEYYEKTDEIPVFIKCEEFIEYEEPLASEE